MRACALSMSLLMNKGGAAIKSLNEDGLLFILFICSKEIFQFAAFDWITPSTGIQKADVQDDNDDRCLSKGSRTSRTLCFSKENDESSLSEGMIRARFMNDAEIMEKRGKVCFSTRV